MNMVPVPAEQLFTVAGLPVTNSLLTGWIVVAVFVTLAVALKNLSLAPRGLQNAIEALIETMFGFMDQVTHDRAKSRRFLPIVGTLFMLILISNWMGLLPGFGTIGIWRMVHGETELVPLLRPATADLNLTLAMAVTSVLVSHLFGMITLGFFTHWNKFIQIGSFWKSVRRAMRMPAGEAAIIVFTAFIEIGVGLIELVSEVAKVISLSFRLFGNVFAGEVLISVLSSLVAFVLPTPFMFMELIVGVVQALVFSMLTLVYLTVATELPHGAEEHAPAAA